MRDRHLLLRWKPMRFPDFDAVVAWVLGISFIASGVPHLGNPYFLLGSIYSYDLVGPRLGQMLAMWLPFLLVILATCLISGLLRGGAHLIALPVLFGFATIQTIAKARGLEISCGCFGPRHESTIGWSTLPIIYALTLLSLTRLTAACGSYCSKLRSTTEQGS